MVNQDLLNFVNESLKSGKSVNDIELELVTNGWQAEDIQEALGQAGNPTSPQANAVNPNISFSQVNKHLSILGNIKLIIPATIIIVLVIAGLIVTNSNKKSQQQSETKSQNTTQRFGFDSLIPQASQQKIDTAVDPSYRLFLKTVPGAGRKATYQLTLISPDGKLVKTIDIPYKVVLKASLKNMWLFGETFTSCVSSIDHDPDDMTKACNFWILHSDGKFEKVAESFNKELIAALGNAYELKHFFPVSDSEVLYQQCNNVDGCKIYKVNLLTGEKSVTSLKGDYKFYEIQEVSRDYSKVYIKDLFPKSEQEYNEKVFHLLALDLKSGQVQDLPVKGVISSYNKYWVSPNGKYLVYTVEGIGPIKIYDVESKKVSDVSLPQGWQPSSLGGDTLPTPIWSPDSKKFLFSAYTSTPSNGIDMPKINNVSVAYIDVDSMSTNLIYSFDTKDESDISQFGAQSIHHSFGGLGWFDNNTAQFSLTQSNGYETQSAKNYEYHTDKKELKELPNEYGELIGNYYF